jgi:dTDP-L-rhamnose 4-epimerase
MSNRRVLVTGAAGFIGSWLTESLLQSGCAVNALDSLSPQIHGHVPAAAYPWLRHPSVTFKRGDIRDTALLDDMLRDCEVVVHLAAETGTGQSMYRIAHYYDVNVQATAALLESIGSRHRQVKKIILASSRSVYGEGAYDVDGNITVPPPRSRAQLSAGRWDPIHADGSVLRLVATPEWVQPRPASIYAATKLACEQLAEVFAETYGTEVIALRLQNVYGERQSLENPYTGILSIFSKRMLQGLPVSIFEDGKESRDFVHVSDAVAAITRACDCNSEGFRAVNVGSGRPTSVLDLALSMRKFLRSNSEVAVSGEFRCGDIRHCYADLTLARKLLGYEPAVSMEDGLQRFARWVSTQPMTADRSREAQLELNTRGLGCPNR